MVFAQPQEVGPARPHFEGALASSFLCGSGGTRRLGPWKGEDALPGLSLHYPERDASQHHDRLQGSCDPAINEARRGPLVRHGLGALDPGPLRVPFSDPVEQVDGMKPLLRPVADYRYLDRVQKDGRIKRRRGLDDGGAPDQAWV